MLDLGKIGRKKKAPSASDLKSSLTPSGKLRRYVPWNHPHHIHCSDCSPSRAHAQAHHLYLQ